MVAWHHKVNNKESLPDVFPSNPNLDKLLRR
jgi:hypothetical protein